MRRVYIQDYAAACSIGADLTEIAERLFAKPTTLAGKATLTDGRVVPTAPLSFRLITEGRSRTNRLLAHTMEPLAPVIARAIDDYGKAAMGVVIGTSTTGIAEGSDAYRQYASGAGWPDDQVIKRQNLSDPVSAALELSGAEGPAYAISTACTSGAKAIAAGARMIRTSMCEAVLCGGVDTLCDFTLHGFAALDALSDIVSNPFSVNRRGINIGEGAGMFLLTAEPSRFRVAGWGESSDAHHISSPDPAGIGAELALRKALTGADIAPQDVGYVHLHGTGTVLNDAMESALINRMFGADTPCSSTKPMTGHTLGAAGALQAAFCLLAMEHGALPPHCWDGAVDPALAPIGLVPLGWREPNLKVSLSTSYAFGGNNAALVLAAA